MGYTRGTYPQVGGGVLPYLQMEGALFLSLPLAGRPLLLLLSKGLEFLKKLLVWVGTSPPTLVSREWIQGRGAFQIMSKSHRAT